MQGIQKAKFHALLIPNQTITKNREEVKSIFQAEIYRCPRATLNSRRPFVCLVSNYGKPNALGRWNFNSGNKKAKRIKGEQIVRSSYDEEFRSSQSIAIGLHRRYQNVVERGCGENLREFIKAGVTAYSLGCTEEGLRSDLFNMKISNREFKSSSSDESNIQLSSKSTKEQIEECILWLSIIFITILCTPQPTIVRWSKASPVSTETKLQWKGFCAIIANAYFTRGMAW
eukprot:TRINITY_DN1926_c0_g1_i2.p1 TRINITY_DN1926_c0_g1~~TRINITY_DN1926_c0_g1_i2.p1  ORF type:complete len:229 (-),score=32.49 TRINITY_DN1926_c0_g1_i2:238-924(-)